MDIATKFTSS
jgi:hypothetical protein